jgi:hypothetical protein
MRKSKNCNIFGGFCNLNFLFKNKFIDPLVKGESSYHEEANRLREDVKDSPLVEGVNERSGSQQHLDAAQVKFVQLWMAANVGDLRREQAHQIWLYSTMLGVGCYFEVMSCLLCTDQWLVEVYRR